MWMVCTNKECGVMNVVSTGVTCLMAYRLAGWKHVQVSCGIVSVSRREVARARYPTRLLPHFDWGTSCC